MTLAPLAILLVWLASATAEPLPVGGPSEILLTANEPHEYHIDLDEGQALRVTIEQSEIDVAVSIHDPKGRLLVTADTPFGRTFAEEVSVVAETAGLHRLEVRAYSESASPGHYRLEVVALRPATAEDRLRFAAEQLTNQAHAAARERTGEALRRALATYQDAAQLWQTLGDAAGEAMVLQRSGQLYRRLGEPQAALASLDRSLALARTLDNPRIKALILNGIGLVNRGIGAFDEALVAYDEAVGIWQQLDDREQLARVRNNQAIIQQSRGHADEALVAYTEALTLFRQLSDRPRQAIALNNMGGVLDFLGQPLAALERYDAALTIAQEIGNHQLEADVRNNLGSLLSDLGELHQALEQLSAARDLFRKTGNPQRQATVLNNLGSLMIDLGSPAEAEPLLDEALRLFRQVDDGPHVGLALINRGRAARDQGDLEAALRWFDQARNQLHRAEEPSGEAQSLYHLAVIHHRLGRLTSAVEHARAAATLFAELGNRSGEVMARRVLGQILGATGSVVEARRCLQRALATADELKDVAEQGLILHELGRLERHQGRLGRARTHLETAVGLFESLRSNVAGEGLRTAHFATVRETYELLIDVMLRLAGEGSTGKELRIAALQSAEKCRARGLFDVLQRARIEPRDDETSTLHHKETALRRQLDALALRRRRLVARGLRDDIRRTEELITRIVAEHRLIEARLAALDPMAAPLAAPEVDVAELRQRHLEPGTVLLEYLLAEPESYLWVVSPESLQTIALPGREEIETASLRAYKSLASPSSDRAARDAHLAELSRLVLWPALEAHDARRWVIVADGALQLLPFAALPIPKAGGRTQPLVQHGEVIHLPSAAVLGQLRAGSRGRAADGPVAVLADPVLEADDPRLGAAVAAHAVEQQTGSAGTQSPAHLQRLGWSQREAEIIAKEAVGQELLIAVGFEATRELVLRPELGQQGVVHLATHGIVDARFPQLSALILSRWDASGNPTQGFIRLHDIFGLRWSAELVVLSGCDTAVGTEVRGEGLVGLARGFLHAGARQVVASQWRVRDRATAELMQRFYGGLYRDGLAPAAALRAAQLSLLEDRRWRDPRFWAPFVLIGDWRDGS